MRVLLTGATGFVGSYLYPALRSAGYDVTCASRHPERVQGQLSQRDWTFMDVEDQASIVGALSGCDAAFYLIHGMGQGSNYPDREALGARNFIAAADQTGLARVVYLGGPQPRAKRASKHLHSRHITGELLRSAKTSTLEVRAAMIIGEGSTSWTMVRDLAARLPAIKYDLDPQEAVLWEHLDHVPDKLEAAAERALADQNRGIPSPAAIARMNDIGEQFRSQATWTAD